MKSKDWRPTAFVETTPGVVTEQEADAGRLDERRSMLAFLSRLVAIDAAAVVLTVALIEKAFAQPLRREAVGIAIGAFLLSLVVGGLSCLVLLASGPRVGARRPSARAWLATTSLSFLGLAAGVAALAWFFFANWLR